MTTDVSVIKRNSRVLAFCIGARNAKNKTTVLISSARMAGRLYILIITPLNLYCRLRSGTAPKKPRPAMQASGAVESKFRSAVRQVDFEPGRYKIVCPG